MAVSMEQRSQAAPPGQGIDVFMVSSGGRNGEVPLPLRFQGITQHRLAALRQRPQQVATFQDACNDSIDVTRLGGTANLPIGHLVAHTDIGWLSPLTLLNKQ